MKKEIRNKETSFIHPYYFTETELADLLSSVYYKGSDYITGKRERMVFRVLDELQNIIPPIISALSKAPRFSRYFSFF